MHTPWHHALRRVAPRMDNGAHGRLTAATAWTPGVVSHPRLRVLELLLHIAQVLIHDVDAVLVLLQGHVRAVQLALQFLQPTAS